MEMEIDNQNLIAGNLNEKRGPGRPKVLQTKEEKAAKKLLNQQTRRQKRKIAELKIENKELKVARAIPPTKFDFSKTVNVEAPVVQAGVDDGLEHALPLPIKNDFFSLVIPSIAECVDFLSNECNMSFSLEFQSVPRNCEIIQCTYISMKAQHAMHAIRRRKGVTFVKQVKMWMESVADAFDDKYLEIKIKKQHERALKKQHLDPVKVSIIMDESKSSCLNYNALNLVQGLFKDESTKKGDTLLFPHSKTIARCNADIQHSTASSFSLVTIIHIIFLLQSHLGKEQKYSKYKYDQK
jgi:hypothetical protein